MERHTVSRLIGAPPGYVGFDQGGLLTDAIDQHPHCVLLLDEIEKAHPDLYNILLQVMDHGKLTDHNGKTIDFRNVILIMTTNAGAPILRARRSASRARARDLDDSEAINRLFAPEFRNRLDAIVPFGHLPVDVIKRVVDKFIMQLEAQLADRNVTIELTDEARGWLVEHGYDEAMGARPMSRVIHQHIKTPLADEVLFGRLKNGGAVRVVVVGDDKRREDARLRLPGRPGAAATRARHHRGRQEARGRGVGTRQRGHAARRGRTRLEPRVRAQLGVVIPSERCAPEP